MVSSADYALLNLTDAELDVMLGEALTASAFGSKDLSDIEKQTTSRRWLSDNLAQIRSAVCGSQVRILLFSPEKEKRNLLFAAVADALGQWNGLPVPASVLSARLLHYGLDRVCLVEEKDPPVGP